jgi:hypothetical protein
MGDKERAGRQPSCIQAIEGGVKDDLANIPREGNDLTPA